MIPLPRHRNPPTFAERAIIPSLFAVFAAGSLLVPLLIIGKVSAGLTFLLMARQDIWLLLAGFLILLAALVRLPRDANPPEIGRRALVLLGVAILIGGVVGRHLVLLDYDMSRDEQMASFDANIFASGNLVAPLQSPWAQHADALNTEFMPKVTDRVGWASGYLPINAAIRGLFGTVGLGDLVGPLAVLLAAMALWACARKIWPEDRSAAVLALVLFACSGQVLISGMTSYAMPLHLLANLVWLWLFLRNRPGSDLVALGIGFIATGLHQPLFHPLFALPLLVGVVLDRDWRRAALYFFGYLSIGAFWLWWPHYVTGLAGNLVSGAESGFASNSIGAFFSQDRGSPLEVIANWLRFLAWQHILLAPLLVVGLRHALKDRLMAALAGSLAFTAIVVGILVPYQGHGFGYRYVHGLIGNAILLAVYGWMRMRTEFPQWNGYIRRTTLGTLLVLLPMQLNFAHNFYAPYALASRAIDRSGADYALIEAAAIPFGADLVSNDPFLKRRPIRLSDRYLDLTLLRDICRTGATFALLPEPHYEAIRDYFGRTTYAVKRADRARVDAVITGAGCRLR